MKEEDIKLVYQWYKDPVTRSMSVNQKAVAYKTFLAKFKLAEETAFIMPKIYKVEGRKVAFVSFDNVAIGEVEININMNPEERGKKLSSVIIDTAVKNAFNQGMNKVYARIKQENIISIRAFEKAGFKHIRKDDEGLMVFVRGR